MAIYGTPKQCKEFPEFYEELPKGYVVEIMKKIQEQKTKSELEKRVYSISSN